METTNTTHRGTILLVNDNRIILTVLEAIVEQLGFSCLCAEDGEQALEALTPEVCCIITDIKMPVMDGLTLIKSLRQDARFRSYHYTPIIVVTADKEHNDWYVGAGDMPDIYSLGFPIRPDSLRTLLQRINLLDSPEERKNNAEG